MHEWKPSGEGRAVRGIRQDDGLSGDGVFNLWASEHGVRDKMAGREDCPSMIRPSQNMVRSCARTMRRNARVVVEGQSR